MHRLKKMRLFSLLLCAALLLAACTQSKQRAKTVSVTAVTLPQQEVSLASGETFQLKPSAAPSGAKAAFTYTSSDSYTATVDSGGKITGVARGSCTVTASAGGRQAQIAVTVTSGISAKNIAQSDASWTNTRVPVLMYHSISTVEGNNLCVPPEKFAAAHGERAGAGRWSRRAQVPE